MSRSFVRSWRGSASGPWPFSARRRVVRCVPAAISTSWSSSTARFDPFMDLKLLLEDTLGRPVDLVTTGAMKPALRARIEAELLRVA